MGVSVAGTDGPFGLDWRCSRTELEMLPVAGHGADQVIESFTGRPFDIFLTGRALHENDRILLIGADEDNDKMSAHCDSRV